MKYIVIAVLLASLASISAHAQEFGGGVNVEGSWWLGEGLKQGDYFSYRICHVEYLECTTIQADLWIQGEKQVGSESKWLAKAVIYDGGKIFKGEIEFSQVVAEPSGSSPDYMAPYSSALKSSISWLSAFATSNPEGSDKGPKEFNRPSWGKIANIGGEQVKPMEIESITVPAGSFDTIIVGWKTGGAQSKIWVVDDFPFPIKALTWTHVNQGIPPREYEFTLLDYRQDVQADPFADIQSTAIAKEILGCPDNDQLPFASLKKTTENGLYGLEVFYKPEEPIQGCEMQWRINFKRIYDETEFLNRMQYDIVVVDDDRNLIRNLASEFDKLFLYSPSGQSDRTMTVKEPVGENTFMIVVYGSAPNFQVPEPGEFDTFLIPITIVANDATPPPPDDSDTSIPSWIKTNAKLWADGLIDDSTFVSGIQYMIAQRIIVIPDTVQQDVSAGDGIPSWIKTNAKLWADGLIDDSTFVSGIQHLVTTGIIQVS